MAAAVHTEKYIWI